MNSVNSFWTLIGQLLYVVKALSTIHGNLLFLMHRFQWRIQGGARDVRPRQANFFSFPCSFQKKLVK